jgi:flagellar motility protein MotE (MotC chaperone)
MKNKIIIFLMTISLNVMAEDKKIYTQNEFDEKLKSELKKEIDNIKAKSVSDLTKELIEKQHQLRLREDELKIKNEQIELAGKELEKRTAEFELEQKKILGCIDKNQEGEELRVNQMVSVISTMKPEKAAQLLSVQDSTISVKIISKIEPTKASKIFNLMDKEVSARLQKEYLNMKQ